MHKWLELNSKALAAILAICLLSLAFVPIITSNNSDNGEPADITIINVYSYPTVGGKWMVMFTTIGKADLKITATNGTTWSKSDNDHDLRFLKLECCDSNLHYEWIDNSVIVRNYSCDDIGYEKCKVLTEGKHTLKFQFGDDIAYAFNDASNWWNNSFKYRKKITITGQAGAGTDYQVLLKIGETSGASGEDFDLGGNSSNFPSAKNDGGDLRFVDNDNTTLLDFWVENVSGAAPNRLAKIWVEIKDSLENNVDIYCYYGNPSASNASSGTDTFIVFDDFEGSSLDNNIWTTYDVDSTSLSNSILTTTCTNDDPTAIIADVNGAGPTGNNVAIRSYFRATGGSHSDQRMGVKIKCNTNDGRGYTYVLHDFANTDAIQWLDDMVAWGAVEENSFSINTWYTFEISHDGNDIRARRDDGSWKTWTRSGRSGYPALNPGGYSEACTGEWDWAVVRKCISTEPSFSSVGSQEELSVNWIKWTNSSNPDTSSPWSWNFDFLNGTGYYYFYSKAVDNINNIEDLPTIQDAECYYSPISYKPTIDSYDLVDSDGSKLNNATGSLDVNNEYVFTVNITDKNNWVDVDYIDIEAWYDNGNDASTYNQTQGGNLNMHLQYENTTGTPIWRMIWPDDEAQIIQANCTETIINSTTRIINFSFIPGSQVRWSSSNNTWNTALNTTNDLYSWNFNITAEDATGKADWKQDEYGIYKYTSISADSDWVDVQALPGFSDDSSTVTLTYTSNYDYNLSIYFEENLTHTTLPSYNISIANNVEIKANTDPTDDITSDKTFNGIGETNSIDIINTSGAFQSNGTSQTVDVQFRVTIPIGTMGGKYTAKVATKISHD
jgi:hypothetical protein